jgi:uncharacterized protein (DUF1810 family)
MTETDGKAGDPYHLQRFVDAQASCFAQVHSELVAGQKRSHWMWFIFPQIRGLGSSPMAHRFAIAGLDEAKAYLIHPILGPRLCECTALVNAVKGGSVGDIFGYPDDLKFHSSVTLFALAVSHLVNAVKGRSVGDIFAYPDDVKFHSSATLSALAVSHVASDYTTGNRVFADALAKYFDGAPDQATLDRLAL